MLTSHTWPDAARGRGWMLLRNQVPTEEPAVLAGWGRVLLTVDGDLAPCPLLRGNSGCATVPP